MKLKTLKIWLFLIPIVGILGIVLFVQSQKNQQELEAQNIRSIIAMEEDIKRALPDYYARVSAFFVRKGYAEFAIDPEIKSESEKIARRLSFDLAYQNARVVEKANAIPGSLMLKDGKLFKPSLPIKLSQEDFDQWSIANSSLRLNKLDILKPDRVVNPVLVADLSISIAELVRKQENSKIFEQFVITDQNGIGIHPESFAGLQVFIPKSSRQDTLGNTISGVTVEQLTFSNALNRVYISPLPLENLNLYVIGMMKDSNFQRVSLRINFNLISALLLFLFLLIASIPLLGIINLSKGDNLTQNKVIQSGISLMGLFLVVGFTVSTYKNSPEPIDAQTYALSDQIRNSVNESLLAKKDVLLAWASDSTYQPKTQSFNELIGFNKAGFADLMTYEDKNQGFVQINYQGKKSAIDLADRRYFQYFQEEGHGNNIYLQSHHSRGSGKLETVLSKNFSDPNTGESNIKAITFNLEIDPKINKSQIDITRDHRFLVFKKDGGIVYLSKKIASPISKIQEGLSEEKWKEISALISNNEKELERKLQVPIYLNGNQYLAIIQQIEAPSNGNSSAYDEPIWLMYLVNQNIANVFISLASFEAVTLMGIYFLFLVISLGIKLITRKNTDIFQFKTFIYEGIKPVADNLNRLQYLTLVYILVSILLLVIYFTSEINHLEFVGILIFASSLISLLNLTTQIPKSDFKNFKNLSLSFFASLGFVLLQFLMICLIFQTIFWQTFLSLLLLVLVTLVWFGKQEAKGLLFTNLTAADILTLYLGTWFLVIGFLPGYMIHSKTYSFEKMIWDSSQLINGDEIPGLANQSAGISEAPSLEDAALTNHASLDFATYESARRSMMFALCDPFDQRIVDFITPNQSFLQQKLQGKSEPLSLMYFFWISLVLVILGFLIRWIQEKIFFDLKGNWKGFQDIDLSKDLLFLCSTNSENIDEFINEKLNKHDSYAEELLLFDMLYGMEELSKIEIDPAVTCIHVKNFHCLKDPLEIIKFIFFLKMEREFAGKLIISSGKSWKDTANTISDERERMRFSETFSDFHFILLQLRSSSKKTDAERDISKPKDYNDLMLKQRSRKAYLYNLWTELNFDEKMACYSFAQEGFFNIARKDTLIELAQKGIIVPVQNFTKTKGDWDDWELFSAVFRKYILENSTDAEVKSFQTFEKLNGNASTIQVSAVSFVLICVALIGFYDKNFFNEAYAYATGSLGILGTLYTLINRGLSTFKFGKTEA